MDGSGCVHEDRHVAVVRVVAAVLGNLAAAGVDDADLDAAEHVWVARIGVRDADEIGGLVTSIDLRQAGVRDLLGAAVHAVVVVKRRGRAVVPQVALDELGRVLRLDRQVALPGG